MSENKTDELIRNKFMPKIKAFTNERLAIENAKQIYNFLKHQYDADGWKLYEAAKGILQVDVFSEFPTEDNMGYFEDLDGYGLLKWLEIAKFAEKEYEQLFGGYEKLKSHTLDESSPEYQEYQNKLWIATIRSITITLVDKQPYLLEEFWNKLSYMENIIEKGLSTKYDLYDKINAETKNIVRNTTESEESQLSEYETKWSIYNALYDIQMTEEMVQALFMKDDVLGDMYNFFIAENKDNLIYLMVYEYLYKAEHDYIAEKLYERVKIEYETRLDEINKLTSTEIIMSAYEIVTLDEIRSVFEINSHLLSTEQLKGLMCCESPLWSVYNEWQDYDVSNLEDMFFIMKETASEKARDIEEKSFEFDTELENDDGQEL